MLVHLYIDDVWTHIDTDDRRRLMGMIAGDLVAEVPGAKYTWKFKSGEWDGRVQMFNSSGTHISIRSGLLETVLTRIAGHGCEITSSYQPRPAAIQHITPVDKTKPIEEVVLRPYQQESVNRMLGHVIVIDRQIAWRKGICQVATGGGKTQIAAALYQRHPVNTMFLVHRKDLLYQAKERFESYNMKASIMGDGKTDVTSNLIIATMQTILSRLEEGTGYTRGIIHSTDQVFFDEAHLMASTLDKGNQFTKVADEFVFASRRWGLTATPFMRSQYDNLLLEGVTGQVLYQAKNQELIKLGYLSRPKVIMKKVPGKLEVTAPKFNPRKPQQGGKYWRDVEEAGIKFNPIRTKLIVDEINKGPRPVLVLCKTEEQAKFIQAKYAQIYAATLLILTGKNSAAQRRAAVEDLESGKLGAVITTTIFDEGVDIPTLRKVILASGGKSQVKLLQRVGRGLRIAAGKHEVEVIDFQDTHHKLLAKHALERHKVWEGEDFEIVLER